jgi:hypothetical protein
MLVLYKPSTGDKDGLKGDNESFAKALLEFLSDPIFPLSIEAEIWRKRQRYRYVPKVGEEFQVGASERTPNEEEREHELHDEAQATAAVLGPVDNEYNKCVDDIQDAQFNEDELSEFDLGLDLDWSEGYTASGCTFLSEHSKRFYALQRTASYWEPFSLFDPNIHMPENCQGFAQTFLVCTTLYFVKQYNDYPSSLEDPKHPCYNFFTQGNPGTGKPFDIMTILNCIRVLCGCVMECAASVAPTGCAASLSKGRTSHRSFKFPAGTRISAQPYDSNTFKVADAQAFLNQMEALFALVSDEVSIKGRKHFAREDHRCREGRKHIVSNTDHTWGGIPVQLAFRDVQQLPAVACKALYDSDPASKSASACACGRLAMADYLDPPPGTNDEVIAIIMDKVIRQTDPDFRNLLQKVRDGTMDDEAVDFLLRQHYSSLSKEERESFNKDALFLMPTWKQTKPITKKCLL